MRSGQQLIRLLTATTVLGLAVTQGCGSSQVPGDSQLLLINGTAATQEMFAPLLWIGSCTAVLAEPDLIITAAHCVHEPAPQTVDGIRASFQSGAMIQLTNDKAATTIKWSIPIKETLVHPIWSATCTQISPCERKRGAPKKNPAVPDIAAIRLVQPLTDIRPAILDLSPVAMSAPVYLTGYGCEGGINTGERGRKQFKTTKVADGRQALAHEGSQRADSIPETLSSNFVTYGKSAGQGDNASLCPGDSGGPVFRIPPELQAGTGNVKPKKVLHIVGVNSDYTFKGEYEEKNAIAQVNIHTRLDTPAVADWLLKVVKIKLDPSRTSGQDIFLALETSQRDVSKTNFVIATNAAIESVSFCWGEVTECPTQEAASAPFKFTVVRDGRKFFTAARQPETKRFTIVGRGIGGNILERQVAEFSPNP